MWINLLQTNLPIKPEEQFSGFFITFALCLQNLFLGFGHKSTTINKKIQYEFRSKNHGSHERSHESKR